MRSQLACVGITTSCGKVELKKPALCLLGSRAPDLSFVDPVQHDGMSLGDTSKWIDESQGVLHESNHVETSSIVWLSCRYRDD